MARVTLAACIAVTVALAAWTAAHDPRFGYAPSGLTRPQTSHSAVTFRVVEAAANASATTTLACSSEGTTTLTQVRATAGGPDIAELVRLQRRLAHAERQVAEYERREVLEAVYRTAVHSERLVSVTTHEREDSR